MIDRLDPATAALERACRRNRCLAFLWTPVETGGERLAKCPRTGCKWRVAIPEPGEAA